MGCVVLLWVGVLNSDIDLLMSIYIYMYLSGKKLYRILKEAKIHAD